MYYYKKSEYRILKQNDITEDSVRKIIKDIITNKDEAIMKYNMEFDKSNRSNFRLTKEEIQKAYEEVSPSLIEEMKIAAANIEGFSRAQKSTIGKIENYQMTEGVILGHKIIPINSCCCYVPGGSYPLYSSALMLVIPAKIAGVKRIVACSPVMKGTNQIHPATVVAMNLAGADEIYAVGGAQAIAAFSYGTKQIKPVDIIVGPGNQYVAEAKRQCYGQVGIDFVAGPSEVLIIAQKNAKAEYIAADILAQSEHDYQAKAVLITDSLELAKKVTTEIKYQLKNLGTSEIAEYAWNTNGEVIIVKNIDQAYKISNSYAPEHLELHVEDEEEAFSMLTNYGSLFVGENAAEVFGDYVSGTNHTLPTAKASRYTGGVYVGTFLKTCTWQKISKIGINKIGNTAYEMAKGEGLSAHAYAAKIRLQS